MIEEEKLYSLADIAKKTKLTDRTIRNYLANGTLKGRKIGGQWRFTQNDINALFNNEEFADDMLSKSEKNINKYVKNEFVFNSNNTMCSILNVTIDSKEKRKLMYSKIKELPVDDDKKEQVSFIEENGHIKMVIIASFDFVYKVLEVVKEVIDL